MDQILGINQTFFTRKGLIRLPLPEKNLPSHLKLNLSQSKSETASTVVKIKYKNGKYYNVLLVRPKIESSSPVYQIQLPSEIFDDLKKDFYYSWARFYNDLSIKNPFKKDPESKEFLQISFPKNQKNDICFRLNKKSVNTSFNEIKGVILENQKTYYNRIKGKLVEYQSDWISRTDLALEKNQVEAGGNKPSIYCITNSKNNFSEFYIGKSKNGINALKSKGKHRENGANFDWDYFRYTQYNLGDSDIKLLGEIEANHIHNFSRLVSCPRKRNLSKNYTIDALYAKVDSNGIEYQKISILNKDHVGKK
jgi:hypothetical protein